MDIGSLERDHVRNQAGVGRRRTGPCAASKIGAHANLVSDAHLAALALEYGLTLRSTGGDLRGFRCCADKTRSPREDKLTFECVCNAAE